MDENFLQWKQQCMAKIDLSKKGSVDEQITDIVGFINNLQNYFTTSSCSGRIIVIDGVSVCLDVQKKDCPWLFVTHQKAHTTDVITCLERARGDAVLKFEPFVLHVQCKQLEDAQLLHSAAINSGFRNSGITVGKKGKIIMAVRSTHCLEVPLTHKGLRLVNEEYVDFLVEVANQKMQENASRIKRFYECLQSAVCPAKCCKESPDLTEGTSVYRKRRKRTQDCSYTSLCQSNKGSASNDEDDGLESGLGIFT